MAWDRPYVPDTEYRRVTRSRYDLEWSVHQAAIDYDKKCGGMYPLICNDRNLTAAQVHYRDAEPLMNRCVLRQRIGSPPP